MAAIGFRLAWYGVFKKLSSGGMQGEYLLRDKKLELYEKKIQKSFLIKLLCKMVYI